MVISVIIPIYNTNTLYLRECIESVLKYECVEIILVDDGSTDKGTIKTYCEYQDKYSNVKVIIQENKGLSRARNLGIEKATGEYVIFLDSDDWWEGDFILKGLDIIKQSSPDLLICEAKKVECDTGITQHIGKEWQEIINWNKGETALLSLLEFDNKYEWYAWRYLIKKSFLLKNSLSFFEGIVYEDVEFIPRMIFEAEKIVAVPGPFVNYRFHNLTSILNTPSAKKSLDKIMVVERSIEFSSKLLNRRLKYLYLQNISQLYLSAYGDYNNGVKIPDKRIKNSFTILKYNKTSYGKMVYSIINLFGFRLGTYIIRQIGKVIVLKNKLNRKGK